jgi:guanylate kinase
MKNLFLIDGASGTGKSDLMRWVADYNAGNVTILRKGTTREERDYEKNDPTLLLDLDHLTADEFKSRNYEYTYRYGGASYGISAKDLTRAVTTADDVFLIVRNTNVIKQIAVDYQVLNVVPVFLYTDSDKLVSRLRREGLSGDMLKFRMARSKIAMKDYFRHPEVYREVIINNSDKEAFHNIIERLVAKYASAPSCDPFLVSVMMSYNPDNKKLDDYFDAMEAAVRAISPQFQCERVDKAPGSPKIADKFRELIARSGCVIVDLTESKQNVYYELGYIQAMGKTCVITAEEGTVPSFYPRAHKILFYPSARELRTHLTDELFRLLGQLPGLQLSKGAA